MEFTDKIRVFLNNSGYNNLFISFFPALFTVILANNIFTFNYISACLAVIVCIFLNMSTKIFDDFLDFILSKTKTRLELEKTGIRGLYTKGSHFIDNKTLARKYFYYSIFFLVIALSLIILTCYILKDCKLLLFVLLLSAIGIINYHPKFKHLLNHTGYEIFAAVSNSFILMLFVFYSSSKCLTFDAFYIALIVFFLSFNIFYTSSLLNQKPDIITQKMTLPIIIKKENLQFLFSVFLTLFPFLLTFTGIYLKILPKISAAVFLLIFHSIWFLYLIFIFLKEPQKPVKWHILMGINTQSDINEQNNQSWYFVRYNLLRNIYITYLFILTISLINWNEIFIF